MNQEKILAIFNDEASEHISKLSDGLLSLEKEPGNEKLITELMRCAHTLKGASKMMKFDAIAQISHGIEDTLEGIKDKKIAVDAALIDGLLKSVDSLKRALGELRSKGPAQGERAQAAREAPKTAEFLPSTIKVPLELSDEILGLSAEIVRDGVLQEQRRERLKELISGIDELQSNFDALIGKIRAKTDDESSFEKLIESLREAEAEIMELKVELAGFFRDVSVATLRSSAAADRLHETVRQMRLYPLSIITDGLSRCVRDLAHAQNKEIDFLAEGENTALDAMILSEIKDPLMHVIRNSVDHGIEPPEERRMAGKPARGMIKISAYRKKEKVYVEVFDDGKGIDPKNIMEAAVRKKFITPADAGRFSTDEMINLIFASGFTTARIITDVSGRGVGLDVVKSNVERLRGRIYVDSKPGSWTKFTFELPLTLAVFDAVLFKASGSVFALDASEVEATSSVEFGKENQAGVRTIWLADILGLGRAQPNGGKLGLILLRHGSGQARLIVDALLREERIFMQGTGPHLGKIRNIAGFSALESGDVAIVLDAAETMESSKGLYPVRWIERKIERKKRSGLIIEDSFATREMERAILTECGMQVDVASDGESGLDMALANRYDFFVIDVRLPGIDGLEVLRRIRRMDAHKGTPVIIISSLESDGDVEKAIALGANAYIRKHSFDEKKFVDILERLLI